MTHVATGRPLRHRTIKYDYDSLGQVISGKKYWSRIRFIIAIVLVNALANVLLSGCKSTRPARHIDDYFLPDQGFAVQHHEIFATAIPRYPGQRQELVSALKEYLHGSPGAPAAAWAKWPMGSDQVRARDFWASVLSQFTGTPLHLFLGDSDAERDRKIEEFLSHL